MDWMLFIDDERVPSDVYWAPYNVKQKYDLFACILHIAKTQDEAMNYIHAFGMPKFISFDHDLGANTGTGYDVAKQIVEEVLDGLISFHSDFEFYVHSQNPIGKKNIESYLNNYLATTKV